MTSKLIVYHPKSGLKQGHWTPEEDEILLHIVKKFGPHNWEKNSIYHPTRNGKHMRARWLCHLREGVNKSPFTEEEVTIVYYMHDIEKKGWAEIAKRLGNGRTPSSCQNVYYKIVAKNLENYQKSASRRLSDKEKMAIDSLLTVKHMAENKMDIKEKNSTGEMGLSSLQIEDVEQMKTEDCDNFYADRYPTIVYNNDCKLEKYPLKSELKQGHWTSKEDKMLSDIVERFGPHNWEKNSIYHPTRNGRQMRERWLSHSQGVNKNPFTEEEVAIVYYMRCIEQKGWADIAKRLGNGRTPNSCKNVYHNVVAKNLRSCPKSASKYETIYHAITTVPSAKKKSFS
ncbi:10898_t:CDS:2 [Paraglomus brasilianum]|uniref:10898_t:CDS:1 n=1 Tax=Paraglomus brasilianum TaxID=144538 RepID=A0A9N9A5B0_9GLOM|nr:10898_t:CDS:2 [Paraglomus brasilianum]